MDIKYHGKRLRNFVNFRSIIGKYVHIWKIKKFSCRFIYLRFEENIQMRLRQSFH